MNDLMIHVEKIVRPVRAVQSRKLRMRRELLAHLQSAFDEERARGANEPAALEQAKQRLGEPAELTASLQKTVPWIERVLLAKMPASQAFNRWEARSIWIWGLDRPLTMSHMALMMFSANAVTYAGLIYAVLVVQPQGILAAQFERPAQVLTLHLILLAIILTAIFASGRLIAATASTGTKRLRSFRTIRLMAVIMASPLAVIVAAVMLVSQREPTGLEILRGVIIGGVLVGIMILTGRAIARLRGPYDQWLSLDLAA